ncbi:cupredoxin domain-containing protein [Candidatus Nitrosotenuis aquarius]|uniref:cupredoxin domain-containing protein n=1 Tax=Candidatus Nitrosotenuis aquarius TaxID=1846278 RepID=UPI000C1EBEE3|nr:plastocyanin/azurin family copper-binding protein [Candidatus Nitrosotenuis aquarius]
MKYLAILAVLVGIVFAASMNNAEAQVSGNKAFTFSGSGFAVSSTSISDSSAEITFSITQTKTKSDFTLQDGVIMVDQKDWDLSEFTGSVLQNGKLFRFSAKATDQQGKEATITGIAKLIDKTATESIYTFSGTITDSAKQKTKLVYTSKVSEFLVKPIDKTPKSDVTIKILKGAANPQDATYKTQTAGFRFNFVSEDRITIPPGGTITFVNEDDVAHSLKSGTANYNSHKKTFTADGKISSGAIAPGKSWSVTFDDQGFFRLFDEDYQHIDLTVFVFDTSKIPKTKTPLN